MTLTKTRCIEVLLIVVSTWASIAHAQVGLPDKFLISEYLVEGNTVLPNVAIERAVTPYLGPNKSVTDINAARDALAKAYEAAGYSSASVEAERADPADTEWGKGWVAVLKVVEGTVGRFKISGSEYNLPSEIKSRMPSVAEGKVPHFPSFQEELADVSRMSELSITPLLRPGRDPGTMEVELKVEDKLPLHAWAELSNDQSPDTTPRRLDLGLRYDNLFQAQHSLTLRHLTTPLDTDEIKVWTANYSLPTGVGNDKFSSYVVHSDSRINTNVGTGIIGKGDTVGLRWSRTLRARAPLFHTVTLGADFKHQNEIDETGEGKQLTYIPLSAQYLMLSPDESGRWQLSTNWRIGLGGLTDREINCPGRGRIDQFECRQAGARSSFMAWSTTLKRQQRFGEWLLEGTTDFQFASGPLVGSEDFYIGGSDSVRGYYQSEQGGETGGRASLQLQTPSMLPSSWSTALSTVAFYDAGFVRIDNALPGQTRSYYLQSAGVGVRFSWSKYLTGSLDWARVLSRASRTGDGASRLHANVRAEF